MTEAITGARLPSEVLARRTQLPLKPAPVTLRGALVRLVPLVVERDAPALHARTNGQPATMGARSIRAYDADALVWRYLSGGPFANVAALADWLRSWVEAPNGRCLVVLDQATESPVGSVNLMSNAPEHLKVELGGIWYSPLAQRTGANTEATYLMLGHAFALGYRRVEWKCDALNARSRHAAERMGFRFEGIQDAHFIVKGRNRDTAWFRILAAEWPGVRAHLEHLLSVSPATSPPAP